MTLEELRQVRKERRLTKKEKESYCRLWEASGLYKRAFCRREELPVSTFESWLAVLTKPEHKEEKEAGFVAVKLIGKEAFQEETRKALRFELPNGFIVSGDFARNELATWLRGLSDAIASIR